MGDGHAMPISLRAQWGDRDFEQFRVDESVSGRGHTSQGLMVSSSLPDSALLPSGENATEVTK
jgi:hypothetical protein